MGKRRIEWCLLTFALLGGAASNLPSFAQAPGETDVLRLFYQEKELVTTVSRTEEEARTAPAIVEVFTAADIENMGARTLSDVLRTLESFYMSVQSNSLEYAWIRGIRNRYNDKVLLLVDGIPRRDLTYAHARIDEYLPLVNIERIEVIRGPGSALYGTNAYAGVVSIVTKAPPEEHGMEVRAGGGNFNTREATLQGGYRWGETAFYGYVDGYESDGDGLDFDIRQKEQELRWNPKKRLAAGLTLTHDHFTFRYEYIYSFNTYFADWDVPTWRWNQNEGQWFNDSFLSGEYARRFGDRWSVKTQVYYQEYDHTSKWRDWIYGRQGPDATPGDVHYNIDVEKRGRRWGGEFQANFRSSTKNELVAGASYMRESVAQSDDYWHDNITGVTTRPFYIDPVSVTTWALYLNDTWRPAPWVTLTFGLRGDHNELFGWKTTPRFGAAFHPGNKLVFKLLYGEAFRAPSFREFFTVDETKSFPAGNTDLRPERIRTFEGALAYTFSSYVEAHIVLYRQLTYDSIYAKEYDDPGIPFQYENHEGNQINGVEAGLRFAWPNRATAYVKYSHTDTHLFNVPRNQAQAGLNLPWRDRLNWNITAMYVGDRARDPDDNYYYDPVLPAHKRPDPGNYLLVNTTLRVKEIWKGFEARFSIYNLFDKDYFDPAYEPTKYNDLKGPNRTYRVQVVYRF